jgi:hypothetical protein
MTVAQTSAGVSDGQATSYPSMLSRMGCSGASGTVFAR